MVSMRQGLAFALVLSLAFPGWAIPAAVGTVQGGSAIMVRGTALVPGTTVYSDDKIEVGGTGSALIALQGGAQVQLRANSEVRILKPSDSGALQLVVDRGFSRFRSTGQMPLEAVLADATIRSADGSGGTGYLNMVTRDSGVIGAEKGALVVTTDHDGNSVTVPEGEAMSVRLAEQNSDQKTQHSAKKRRGLILLFGAFVIGGAIGGAIGANTAESSPSKGPAVSPFKP